MEKTIEISYEYYNARLSFDIVESILREYLVWERDSKQTAANKTIAFIDSARLFIKSITNFKR